MSSYVARLGEESLMHCVCTIHKLGKQILRFRRQNRIVSNSWVIVAAADAAAVAAAAGNGGMDDVTGDGDRGRYL